MLRNIYCVLIFFFSFFTVLQADNLSIFEFTEDELSTLKVRKIRGADAKTLYSVGKNDNGNFLRAEANNSASGLGKEIKINLYETPFLNITWRVEKDLNGIKENSKKGHDFAARVSVIKEIGSLPWQKKAMNYVFSSNEKTNSHWMGPYRKQIIDYVASSLVDSKENSWVTVKLNVKEHFKKFLDLDLVEVDGVAIMTDTDNTKQKAVSYYKNIYFSN